MGSFRNLSRLAKWHGSNYRICRIFLKFWIATKVVDAARKREITSPAVGCKFQNLCRKMHGFIDCRARSNNAWYVGKRHSIAAIGIFMDKRDIVAHACVT